MAAYIAVYYPLAIDLPGFADGWGGYRVVHYDQSTDPKLNFHIGRRHTSRTTSRTCRFGPETPFQAATHSKNPETQHALYRLQQCVCWPRGSLGSGPQLGSCLGSLGRRPRGRSRPLTAAAATPCRGRVLLDHEELFGAEKIILRSLLTTNEEVRKPASGRARTW